MKVKEKIQKITSLLGQNSQSRFETRGWDVYQLKGRGEICLIRATSDEEVLAFLMGYCACLMYDNISYFLSKDGASVEYFDTPGENTEWT